MAQVDITPTNPIDGSRSSFTAVNNYTIDTFVKMFELSANDVKNVQKWKQLKATENKTTEQQEEFATLTADLSGKLVTAEDWNKLCDCMVNLEQMYVDKGLNEINNTVEEYVANYTETNAKEAISNVINTTIESNYQIDAVKIIISSTQPEVVEGALWIKPKTT
jgi:hypothetical protein